MRVAVIGAKYKYNLDNFRTFTREHLARHKHVAVDDSYFDTTREDDIQNPKSLFNRVEKILYHNDVVIIEATRRSEGIGLIIGLALAIRKPTLILYNKDERQGEVSSIALASARTTKRSFVHEYTEADLGKTIDTFLEEASDLVNSKFFIILSPEINRYLEWIASYHRVPKVDKIRKLIAEDMANNKEWQKIEKSTKQ